MNMRSAILCTFLLASAAGAHAQWWNPMSRIPPGRWEEQKSSFVYTPVVQEMANNAIQQALARGDFQKLERMHDEFLAFNMAGGNGWMMLNAFERAAGWFGFLPTARVEKLFADWKAAEPHSKLRPAMEAMAWSELAWKARGSGYSSDVTPEARAQFQTRLKRAGDVLKEAGDEAKGTPLSYRVAMSLAGSLGEPPSVLDKLFDEGAKRFPYFYSLYSTRLNFLLPKWGGSYAAVDAFVRASVKRTQSHLGTRFYAMLYSEVAEDFAQGDFFRESPASWRLMRHAFEDVPNPSTPWKNEYATFACLARDRETTRQLLADLGAEADLGGRAKLVSAEACEDLVASGK